MNNDELIEKLLEKQYWVIDFLPRQVPVGSAGQFFAVEEYLLSRGNKERMHGSFAEIVLKLNCYRDILVREVSEEKWQLNPQPAELVRMFTRPKKNVFLQILLEKDSTLITFDSTDSYLTVYNPSSALKTLLQQLTAAQGLFFRQPGEERKTKADKELKEWRTM
jgi:hypothetical protein